MPARMTRMRAAWSKLSSGIAAAAPNPHASPIPTTVRRTPRNASSGASVRLPRPSRHQVRNAAAAVIADTQPIVRYVGSDFQTSATTTSANTRCNVSANGRPASSCRRAACRTSASTSFPAPGAVRPPSPLAELRLDMLLVAVGTDAVAELRLGALLDVAFERAPVLGVVADAFAVGADGEQAGQLLQLAAQAQDALGDREARPELVRVDRFGDEVVGSSFHAGEVLLFATARCDQNEIHVRGIVAGPDAPAQVDAVHLGHVPVGDHHGHACELEDLPRLATVLRDVHRVPGGLGERGELGTRHRIVVDDQDGHRARGHAPARRSAAFTRATKRAGSSGLRM